MILFDFFRKKNKNKPASVYALDGECYRILGKYKKALKELNNAIDLEPNNDMYFASRSLIKKELKDYSGANQDISMAIQLQPNVIRYAEIKENISSLIS